MTSDTADASPAPSACSGNKDVGIIGFAAPLWDLCRLIIFNKWKIKVAMKNVSARQSNRLFEVKRRFCF
jgi:hypothetical protein